MGCKSADSVQCDQTYEGHRFSLYCVQEYEGRLFTGSIDETVREYDAVTAECLHVYQIDVMFKSMVITDGFLYTAAMSVKNPKAVMWSLNSKQPVRSFASHSGDILAIAVDEGLLYTASGFPDSCVKVFDIHTGEHVQDI